MVLNYLRRKIILFNFKKLLRDAKEIKKTLKTQKRFLHLQILNEISKKKIFFLKGKSISFLKEYNFIDFEISIKQLFLSRILYNKIFFKKVAKAFGNSKSLIFPIPKELKIFFHDKNLQLNNFYCLFLLYFTCLREIMKSSIELFKIVFEVKNKREKNYIQVCDLPNKYNPCLTGSKIYDFFNWIKINIIKNNDTRIYSTGNFTSFYRDKTKIVSCTDSIPQLSFVNRIKILIWFLRLFIFSIANLLVGKWFLSFLSFELILLKKQDLNNCCAEEYFFSNSHYIYRPLWTYLAEKKGKKVNLFFYSSSFYGFKNNNHYLPNEAGVEIMSWPNIIFWSKPLLNFYKKEIFNKNVNLYLSSMPIELTDSNDIDFIKNYNGKIIFTIFDSPPRRDIFRILYMPQDFYRSENNGIKFLKDICNILTNKQNILIVIKNKRFLNKDFSKKYKKFLESLTNNPNIIFTNPELSAQKIILASRAVISTPWSSTSQIADYYKIPNACYDPSGTLDKKDRGSQGTILIQDKIELETWIEKNMI